MQGGREDCGALAALQLALRAPGGGGLSEPGVRCRPGPRCQTGGTEFRGQWQTHAWLGRGTGRRESRGPGSTAGSVGAVGHWRQVSVSYLTTWAESFPAQAVFQH